MKKAISADQMIGPFKHPVNIPFNVMPFGASIARLPPAAYDDWIHGRPHMPKIRPTPDPSAPHDGEDLPDEEGTTTLPFPSVPLPNSRQKGTSPNAHVYTDQTLERKWISFTIVIQCLTVLTSACLNIRAAKKDLSSAYRQLRARVIERWRSNFFWCWEAAGLQGGFFQDISLSWGGVRAGSLFFRAITSLVVRYITYLLIRDWMPTIQHAEVLQWIAARRAAGYSAEQCLPAFIRGFLDDFFSFIAGTDEDHERAMVIINQAFVTLNLIISEPKEKEEGGLRRDVDILGLNIRLTSYTMGVPQHKVRRLRHMFGEILKQKKWSQALLSQALGLLQSVKFVIPRRLRLLPLYGVLYSRGQIRPDGFIKVRPSKTAIEIVQRFLQHLDERQSIWWSPTAWHIPSGVILERIPMVDACLGFGYGGVIRIDDTLFWFQQKWERKMTIHIDLCESIAALVGIMTFSRWLTDRKSILQSDSSGCTFCFNKLNSTRDSMSHLCDTFERLQDRLQAEILIAHCPGKKNRWSDACSRQPRRKLHKILSDLNAEVGMGHLKLVELQPVEILPEDHPHIRIDLDNLDVINRLGNGDPGPFHY